MYHREQIGNTMQVALMLHNNYRKNVLKIKRKNKETVL